MAISDQTVLDLEHRVWNAVIDKDGRALDGMFAEEYIEITLDGLRVTKSDVVSESPAVDEIEAYAMDAAKVVWLSATQAILSYHLTLRGRCRGAAIQPKDRWVTSLWRQVDQHWECCLFQQSRFEAPPVSSATNLEPVSMTVADCEAVISFWEAIPGVGLGAPETPAALASYLRRNQGMSLVVRDEQQVVGAVLCGHDGRRGYLHHLAVAVDYRRRGIANSLVQRCLENLAELGMEKCNIVVFGDNDEGRQFWKRCGWSERVDLLIMQHPT